MNHYCYRFKYNLTSYIRVKNIGKIEKKSEHKVKTQYWRFGDFRFFFFFFVFLYETILLSLFYQMVKVIFQNYFLKWIFRKKNSLTK